MRLLEASAKDARKIADIENRCFPDPWSESMIREELENPDFFMLKAEENGRIAGYGGFWLIAGEEAHIGNLAVDAPYRGKGFGDGLLLGLLREAERLGAGSQTLEVRAGNSVAISLYVKHGFTAAGVRPEYYRNGEDAVIMWRR